MERKEKKNHVNMGPASIEFFFNRCGRTSGVRHSFFECSLARMVGLSECVWLRWQADPDNSLPLNGIEHEVTVHTSQCYIPLVELVWLHCAGSEHEFTGICRGG